MRYQERIEFVIHEPFKVKFDDTKRFEFCKHKKWHKVQRVCFWVLTKIGAFSVGERTEYKRIAVDADDFMARLYKQRGKLCQHFHKDGQTLLIGAETYDELMHSVGMRALQQSMSFDARFYFEDERGRRICGLKVEIIPWMSGMIVMP